MKNKRHKQIVLLTVAVYVIAISIFLHPSSYILYPSSSAVYSQENPQTLSRQAYTVLQKNCFGCHGAAKINGLDLRTAESIRAGGEAGPVIVPFEANESRLYLSASHAEKPTMPPGKKLPDADVEILRRWIEAGAP